MKQSGQKSERNVTFFHRRLEGFLPKEERARRQRHGTAHADADPVERKTKDRTRDDDENDGKDEPRIRLPV